MTKREMIERGRRAVVAAYPEDTGREYVPADDWQAHICDAIVDILHFADSKGFDAPSLVDSALGTHFMAERGCGLDEEPDA